MPTQNRAMPFWKCAELNQMSQHESSLNWKRKYAYPEVYQTEPTGSPEWRDVPKPNQTVILSEGVDHNWTELNRTELVLSEGTTATPYDDANEN